MAFQPDPTADLIDEKGHTREDAKLQVPNLDAGAPAASEETPKGGGDVMVPAQTPEEVAAQVRNIPGHPDETHDIDEQVEEAEGLTGEEDDEGDSVEDDEADEAEASDPDAEDEA